MHDQRQVFDLQKSVYRLSAIKKAAYRFGASHVVTISDLDSVFRVELVPRVSASTYSLSARDFPNEVLDQELREIVAEETKPVRDLILAQAFSGLSLLGPAEQVDYRDDPLEIGKGRSTEESAKT